MSVEKVETLVIGAGQAGIAMSEHLGKRGVPHLIIERNRIAERWRSERWDSLVANGPAWHDRFPNKLFDKTEPEGFAPAGQIVDYLVEYAEQFKAPIRTGVEVKSLRKEGDVFIAETADGVIEAKNVVAATGPFQKPVIPALVPQVAEITQIHSATYRNPTQLPEGAVLVIGGGSSGVQIADELRRAGRKVYLSVGPHDRPPRRYRGKDFVWWLGALGQWNIEALEPGLEHVTIAVSGAQGGHTVDFRDLAANGITLVGRTESYKDGALHFSADLEKNIAGGDANYLGMLQAADAYIAREGLDLPEEPEAHKLGEMPACATDPLLTLNLKDAGVTSIVWATGYALDFSWIKLDIFEAGGKPRHKRGVSEVPGLYFLGLAWLSRRASPFIWGVWHDADYLAEQIAGRSA
jgi:putative flavoprotein involved in K+ transport